MHMATIDIKVPDIGDFAEVAVIEVLVKPGDTIKAEQSLITVESDKASMEIPSSHAGVVKGAARQARRQGRQGSVVLTLECGRRGAAPRRCTCASAPQLQLQPKQAQRLPHKRRQLSIQ
jgi:dihydrolipoamide dehydrogenase